MPNVVKGVGKLSPKLIVDWSPYGQSKEESYDLGEAKDLLFGYEVDFLLVVEGRVVRSWKELVRLVNQDCCRGKEEIKVKVFRIAAGG